jgi:hypothetical protein
MSTASTINLPFLKSTFVAPAFASGVNFDYIIENNSNIPIGNYLVWTYLNIKGDTDTDLGPVITVLANVPIAPNTFNISGLIINDGSVVFQSSQIAIITTEQPNIFFQGAILFNTATNAPTVTGTIFFLPI